MHRKLKVLFLSLSMGLLGMLIASAPWAFALEEHLGLHLLFLLRGPVKPPEDVVVAAIDRKTAKQLDLPVAPRTWPRTWHAKLLNHLSAAGASVVAFDLFFNQPRTLEDDHAFANAIRNSGNIVLAQLIDRETIPVTNEQDTPVAGINLEKIVPPMSLFGDAAAAQAPFPLPKRPYKLSQYWISKPGAGDVPTLPIAAFHVFVRPVYDDFVHLLNQVNPSLAANLAELQKKPATTHQTLAVIQMLHQIFTHHPNLAEQLNNALAQISPTSQDRRKIKLIKALIHLHSAGPSRYLNLYGPPGTIKTISYYELVRNPTLSNFAGKAVFVGQTETAYPKVQDGFFTVFTLKSGKDISGVEIAASAFANLLDAVPVIPLAWPWNRVVAILWGVTATLICLRLSAGAGAAGLAGLSCLYLIHAHFQFKTFGTWYPIIVPLGLISPMAYISTLIWKYSIVNKERRNIRKAFGYYLPSKVVDQLTRNIRSLHSENQVLYGICLFTDAAQYTRISESMAPSDLTRFMNQYYEAVFKPIKFHEGIILQVTGDSILALWAASQPDTALKQKACTAALEVAHAVDRFNQNAADHPLPTRIGLHAGEMLLGNIGAMDHFEYRPVGDIVNTASRLEGLNKYLGTRILVSQEVLADLDSFYSQLMGKFVFIGKSQPIEVYELIASRDEMDEKPPKKDTDFIAGIKAFQQRHWDVAIACFERAEKDSRLERSAQFYLQLCHQYRHNPPNDNWNGIVHLEQK